MLYMVPGSSTTLRGDVMQALAFERVEVGAAFPQNSPLPYTSPSGTVAVSQCCEDRRMAHRPKPKPCRAALHASL